MADTLVGVFTVSLQDDRIQIPSHQLVNGEQVKFVLDDPATCVLPFPLNDVDYYFVINARGNDFMVSSTDGGAVINITDKGTGSNEVWRQGAASIGTAPYYQYMVVHTSRDDTSLSKINTPAQDGWEVLEIDMRPDTNPPQWAWVMKKLITT